MCLLDCDFVNVSAHVFDFTLNHYLTNHLDNPSKYLYYVFVYGSYSTYDVIHGVVDAVEYMVIYAYI